MKFYKKGKKDPGIMETEIEIKPVSILSSEILQKLDYFVGSLHAHFPNQFDQIHDYLLQCFRKEIKRDHIDDLSVNLAELLSDHNELKKYLVFTKLYLNYFIQLLKLPENYNWENNQAKVKIRDYCRSKLQPNYVFLTALTTAIGRQTAISFFKQAETGYAKQAEMDPMDYQGMESVEKRWRKIYIEEGKSNNTEAIFGLISKGKFAYRIDNCLFAESMAHNPDKELKYLVCCYKDFENAKSFYNENVVLTLEHTIAGGDDYCSGVLHDTLMDWDLRHPPKEFWDNMGE